MDYSVYIYAEKVYQWEAIIDMAVFTQPVPTKDVLVSNLDDRYLQDFKFNRLHQPHCANRM
jgi:hypothetical protein